jgi:hypothetical protein
MYKQNQNDCHISIEKNTNHDYREDNQMIMLHSFRKVSQTNIKLNANALELENVMKFRKL